MSSKLLYPQIEIQQFESVLVDYINQRFEYREEKPITVLCVLKGGFYITASITRKLSTPIRLEIINLSPNQVPIFPNKESITGQHIVVIDDIYDTGQTCQNVLDYLNKFEPVHITYFHLLHRASTLVKAKSNTPLTMLFGHKVGTNKWLKGYGMNDDRGLGRNLEDIYAID